MKKSVTLVTVLMALLLLQACASHRQLDDDNVASRESANEVSEADIGGSFLWGGNILSMENDQGLTKLTIVSFPLSNSEEPKLKHASTGRFIAHYQGFLEPADFKVGKKVTILGDLTGFKDGKVSQANYKFPLIKVTDINLLKDNAGGGFRLPVSLGIGIGLGF